MIFKNAFTFWYIIISSWHEDCTLYFTRMTCKHYCSYLYTIECESCFFILRPSFHQASVAFSTSGNDSACQPLLWGLRQEGKSSTFLPLLHLTMIVFICAFVFLWRFHLFMILFTPNVRYVSSLQKRISWQMLTWTRAVFWIRKSVMLNWPSITSSLVRKCYCLGYIISTAWPLIWVHFFFFIPCCCSE